MGIKEFIHLPQPGELQEFLQQSAVHWEKSKRLKLRMSKVNSSADRNIAIDATMLKLTT